MTAREIRPVTVFRVLIALTAALVLRSWLQIQLRQSGHDPAIAADLSYLVVPVILIVLLSPLWASEKDFLADQFRLSDLSWRIAFRAIAIGLTIRLMWWSQLVAGVSFGIYAATNTDAVVGPVFSFQCAAPWVVLLGFVVMGLLVPVIEEIVHRGYVQTALCKRGPIVAILSSALVFAVFHSPGSWSFALLAGIAFGAQYWVTGNLWSSCISHATVNGLIQVDWRCFSGQWNPLAADIPLMGPGLAAIAFLVGGFVALLFLLRKTATEAPLAPR